MCVPNFKIIGIVGGSNFQGAGTEFLIHIFVKDDRYRPIEYRQKHIRSREVSITFILRVHSHCCITQKRFRSRSGHRQVAVSVFKRVTDIVEVAIHLFMLYLKVSQCCVAPGAPVNDVITPVNQLFIIETHKDFPYGPGKALIHGKPLSTPVTGTSQPFQLGDNHATEFFPPLPDQFNKSFPTNLVTISSPRGKVFFHHILGSYTRVVRAGLPQDTIPFHPFVSAQNILEGIIEGMAHVQASGYIWRGNDDRKGGFIRFGTRLKEMIFLPVIIPLLLHLLRFVSLGQGTIFHEIPLPQYNLPTLPDHKWTQE